MNKERNRFYFTFGSDLGFPYQDTYLIVIADCKGEAMTKFQKKYPNRHKDCLNCAFVYIHYYDFYKTSLNKIQERFQDRIVISKVIPISDYIDELNTDIDLFILSTGSHLNLPQKTVYINPFLNKEDFDKLEEAIHEISLIKQRNELKDYILNFFDEKLFYKDPPFNR